MRSTTTCLRAVPNTEFPFRTAADRHTDALMRQPWLIQLGREAALVRPSTARDLAAVAQLHSNCSPRSLLDRYRRGGRAPSISALDRALRRPYGVVAVTSTGEVIATGALEPDGVHNSNCISVGLLVADRYQRMGIGTELITHLAGVAHVTGYRELIGYPATAVLAARRLMLEVGRTRTVPEGDAHLHTYLGESAALGLGAVRQRLAG